MEHFIITTTPIIEGHPIKAYLGAINVNIVIGTNLFSDFAASFTDVFGGNSGTYQRKMNEMYESAQKELEKKAKRLGANAIVGFKTDFDEISGKGKSMFMLSATGTACKVDNSIDTPEIEEKTIVIDASRLKQELDKEKLMKKLAEATSLYSLGEKDWAYMTDHPSKDAISILMGRFYFDMSDEEKNKVNSLLNLLDYNDASELVYNFYHNLPEEMYGTTEAVRCDMVSEIIRRCSLFNPAATINLIASSPSKAADILDSDKPYYDTKDLNQMKEILSMLTILPDVGQIVVGKNGMFSKEKELFVCRHGHKNEKEYEFCPTCFENIKGLTQVHIKKIEQFKLKLEMLDKLLGAK